MMRQSQRQDQDQQPQSTARRQTPSFSSKVSQSRSPPTCSFLYSNSELQPLPTRIFSLTQHHTHPRYPGLSSLKLLPTPAGSAPNAGLAFVQYETAGQAGTAREALNEFLLAPETPMKVGWAKRA